MATTTQIQVISRTDFTDQHLLSILFDPSTPLSSNSIRVRSKIISLTVNNLSYARFPDLGLGWWDVNPLPTSTPAPYNDASKWGRIAAWGWGTVLSSTISGVSEGDEVYGYLPIADLPIDLKLEKQPNGTWDDVSPHRAKVLGLYNRYRIEKPNSSRDARATEKSMALDALSLPTFGTSFNLARNTFNTEIPIHPWGLGDPWTSDDADLSGAVVVLAAAGTKTALSLAYMLNRPDQVQKPDVIVGLTSAESADFVKGTGWFTQIVTYGDAESLAAQTKGRKVVIVEFGARENAASRVFEAVKPEAKRVQFLTAAGESKKDGSDFSPEVMKKRAEEGRVMVNAGALKAQAEAKMGKAIIEDFDKAWAEFKEVGYPGMEVVWKNGVEEYTKEYAKMANGKVDGTKGLVFKI